MAEPLPMFKGAITRARTKALQGLIQAHINPVWQPNMQGIQEKHKCGVLMQFSIQSELNHGPAK